MTMDNYLYKNDFSTAEKRLKYLEKIEDPHTFELISRTGLKKGNVCLEVGAGNGSVAEHLCTIVGEKGIVRAVDIDTRFLTGYSYGQLTVVEKNIEEIELNENEYDFIHVRHVLIHSTQYGEVLGNHYRSLKPGGWLLIEESDFSTWNAVASSGSEDMELFDRVVQNILTVYTSRGMDIHCGIGCYKRLSDARVKELISESRCRIVRGASDEAVFHRITMEQLKPSLVETGEPQ